MGVKRHYASWSSWKWEYQWSWDKPYCLRCKQWCPMLQFAGEQICVEDVHFKTLSWSAGFLSWIGSYCISCVVLQRSRVKDLSFLVGYDESKLGDIKVVRSIKGIQSLVEETLENPWILRVLFQGLESRWNSLSFILVLESPWILLEEHLIRNVVTIIVLFITEGNSLTSTHKRIFINNGCH